MAVDGSLDVSKRVSEYSEVIYRSGITLHIFNISFLKADELSEGIGLDAEKSDQLISVGANSVIWGGCIAYDIEIGNGNIICDEGS